MNKSDERFLVTGATGFVGSCIVRELVHRKKRVNILVRNKELNWRLQDVASQINIYECDLLSTSLHEVIDTISPTVIFHLAAYGALPKEEDVDRMIDVNIKGTRNLILTLKKHMFRLFINTGSSSEYGIKDRKMREEDVCEPINDYGVAKVAVTLFCQKIAKTESLPIVTFRLFSPYGYYEKKNRLMPTLIYNSLNNKTIDLTSPSYVRDFIFIEDVVNAYMLAVEKPVTPGEIINIGSGEQSSIGQVAELILKLTGGKSSLQWGAKKGQARQIEPKMWQADIRKAKKILGWEPTFSLKEGLQKTSQWFGKNIHLYE